MLRSDPRDPNQPKHAFRSLKAARKFGGAIYSDARGKEIIVTAVYPSESLGRATEKWDDLQYLGIVSKFVKTYKTFGKYIGDPGSKPNPDFILALDLHYVDLPATPDLQTTPDLEIGLII